MASAGVAVESDPGKRDGGGVCVTGILDTPLLLRMDKVDKVGKVSGFVNLRGEDRRHGILSR